MENRDKKEEISFKDKTERIPSNKKFKVLFLISMICLSVVSGLLILSAFNHNSLRNTYNQTYLELQEAISDYNEAYQCYLIANRNYYNTYQDYLDMYQDYNETYQDYLDMYQNYNETYQDYQTALQNYQNAQSQLDKIDDNTDFTGHFYRVVDHSVRDWLIYVNRDVEVNITYNRYFYYRLDLKHPSHYSPNKNVVVELIATYCTIYDYRINIIADSIKNNCIDSNDDEDVVNAVLSFCQDKGDSYRNIEYGTDGDDDFSKYPIETLVEGNGDCEDKSILFGSLVESLGYDAAIFVTTDHVFVGVHLDFVPIHNIQLSTWYVEIYGKRYYICETTMSGWRVGDCPEELQDEDVYWDLIQ